MGKQMSKESIEKVENVLPIELEDEYEVEKIMDVREGDYGRKEYLVKWKGWEREQDRTWEPKESLSGSIKLLKEFEKAGNILTPASGNSDIDEYEVENIIDVRYGADGKEYLVKWKGWENMQDRTWEPEESLNGSKKLVIDFEKKIANKKSSKPSKRKSDFDM